MKILDNLPRLWTALWNQSSLFGEQYISNFLTPEQPDGPKAPLELVLCSRLPVAAAETYGSR